MNYFTAHRHPWSLPLALLLVCAIFGTSAHGLQNADDMESLKRRFEQRLPEVKKIKSAGLAGETFEGFVLVRTSVSAAQQELLDAENADRKKLYALIAAQAGADPAVVGQRNGKRNFDRAAPGDWLRGQDGVWFQKS